MTTSSTAGQLKVLLVEDAASDPRTLQEMRQGIGGATAVSLVCAQRLSEALALLRTDSFHAILLDLSLPDSPGLEALAAARSAAPDAPIVVLTARFDEEVAVRAVREGAQDYLVKTEVDGALLYKSIRYAIERHRVEGALRTSEARYRSLVESSIQGILIHVNGVIRLANPALAKLLGVNRAEDLVGASIWSFIPVEDHERLAEVIRARREGRPQPQYEARAVRRDGSIIWLDSTASSIEWGGEQASLVTMIEVTDRKRAEEAARAGEERFRQLAENIREAFVIIELPAHRALYVSPIWEEIWGRRAKEIYSDPQVWFDSIHPEDVATVRTARSAVEQGQSADNVFRVIRPDGAARWVRARMFPVLDDGGRVYRMVGLIEDITEVRRKEEQYRQGQRMEAVGRLAGGIAHDFNNLLTAILGYTELVLNDLGPNHPLAGDVREIRNAGQSAVQLTRQLLAFSRRQILQPRVIDLNQVLERMNGLLRRLIGEDVTLRTQLMMPLARVNADPGQIEQVVMNLAVNARDAMPHGGRLTIETANVELDQAYVATHPGATAGPQVMLAVSDTGVGMDEATQRRLFEPFFTTKELGKGTGLGLATVYGIVKQSKGFVWVSSEPGKGSTFKIYLPVVDATGAADLPAAAASEILDGTETVLVVEDQPEVRAVIRETLQRHGYTVVEAASGAEALVRSREYSGTIHLLFTDVVMPGLSGRRVAQLLTSDRGRMRVLYTSGYTDDAIVQHGVLEPGLAFLQKPYTSEALLRKIREVLDASAPPAV